LTELAVTKEDSKVNIYAVLTTIFDCPYLDTFWENLRTFDRVNEVTFLVIPDRKTPRATYERCRRLAAEGMRIRCPNLDTQEAFLSRFPTLAEAIPYDSDNRRNVGFLMAYAEGAEVLVALDDDNVCLPDEDFFGQHAIVGRTLDADLIQSSNGWYNICQLLNFDHSGPVYPRGFPYRYRHESMMASVVPGRVRVVANVGLWLLDPDVDAATRLTLRPFARSYSGASVVLAPGTWTPINTQNTAVHREAIAAYYYVLMGGPIAGLPIDRFGDIWSGYFLQACSTHLGEAVRVGSPLVHHHRNSHDLLQDLRFELGGIIATEELVSWLREVHLEGKTYREAYNSLASALEQNIDHFQGRLWTPASRDYLRHIAQIAKAWCDAIRIIDGA